MTRIALVAALLALLALWAFALSGPGTGPVPGPSDPRAGRGRGAPLRAEGAAPTPSPRAAPSGSGRAMPSQGGAPPPARAAGRAAGRAEARPAPPAATGSVAGHAYVPARLRADIARMQMHVTTWGTSADGSWVSTRVVPDILDPQGDYRLDGLAGGRHALHIVLDGRTVSEPQRFAIEPGDALRGVDFDFRRREGVVGRLTREVDGEPVRGALIRIDGVPPERSDADGRFTVGALPAGAHLAVVTHPDHAPLRLPFTMPAGGATAEVEAALWPGAEARITALARDGRGRAGVSIVLSAPDHFVQATTDERGVATFRGLEPGAAYAVRLVDDRQWAGTSILAPEAEDIREVDVYLGR